MVEVDQNLVILQAVVELAVQAVVEQEIVDQAAQDQVKHLL